MQCRRWLQAVSARVAVDGDERVRRSVLRPRPVRTYKNEAILELEADRHRNYGDRFGDLRVSEVGSSVTRNGGFRNGAPRRLASQSGISRTLNQFQSDLLAERPTGS